MSNLPIEILNNIFESVSRKDSQHCSLACRAWRLAAQRVFFENLPHLTDQQMSNLVTVLSTNDPKQSPGNFFKTLSCRNLSDDFNLDSLDTIFPSLEIIQLAEHQKTLYEKIYTLIMEGKFPKLKQIPLTRWDHKHINLILARKDNITELNIRGGYSDRTPKEIFDKLNLLPRLEFLKLQHQCHMNKIFSLESFLSTISSTLKLIDFRIDSDSKLTMNPPSPNSSNIQPLTNVKVLRITNYRLFFDAEEINYIMKKFPNVAALEISTDQTMILKMDDYVVPTANCVSEFLIYLFNIKNGSAAPPILTDEHTSEVIKNLFNHINSQASPIVANTEITLKIKFRMVDKWQRSHYAEHHSTYITPCNSFSKDKKLCDIEVVYKLLPEITYLPHMELLQEVGDMNVKILEIGNYGLRRESYKVPMPIDMILDYCTDLKELQFTDITNFTFAENMSSIQKKSPSALESLEF